MEKLLYPLWPPENCSADQFRDRLLTELGSALTTLEGVHGLRLTVADSAVAAAAARRITHSVSAPVAVLSLWVDSASDARAWEPLIDRHVRQRTGYLVVEAEPLLSQRSHPSAAGERVHGMCTVVFMQRPAGLDREAWLSLWKGSHTGVAIATQATFGYRQNLVASTLGRETPPCDAIVEENFPPEAMACDHAFYGTGGDEALLQQRMTTLLESCARFIDFASIDVLPMSEYVIKHLHT